MCWYVHNFMVSALHRRPDGFCKSGEILSWAPPAFQKAPPRELLLITGNNSKTWGNTSSIPECHDVPMAPLDTFVQLKNDSARQPIPPEYAFALCTPRAWAFPSAMDVTILPESYLTSDNLGEDNPGNKTNSKKPRKCKGKNKTQNRSKNIGAASSTSTVSPVCAKLLTRIDKERAKQAIQDLQLSSKGSDSEVPDAVDSSTQGGPPEDSRVERPVEPTPFPDKTAQGEAPPGPIMVMTTDPQSVAQEQPTQSGILVPNPVTKRGWPPFLQ